MGTINGMMIAVVGWFVLALLAGLKALLPFALLYILGFEVGSGTFMILWVLAFFF